MSDVMVVDYREFNAKKCQDQPDSTSKSINLSLLFTFKQIYIMLNPGMDQNTSCLMNLRRNIRSYLIEYLA